MFIPTLDLQHPSLLCFFRAPVFLLYSLVHLKGFVLSSNPQASKTIFFVPTGEIIPFKFVRSLCSALIAGRWTVGSLLPCWDTTLWLPIPKNLVLFLSHNANAMTVTLFLLSARVLLSDLYQRISQQFYTRRSDDIPSWVLRWVNVS